MKKIKSPHYFLTAVILGLLAIGMAAGSQIFAQTATTLTTQIVCNIKYSDWSDCKPDGYRYRSYTKEPSDCNYISETLITRENCTYTAPTVPCVYTYGNWGICNPDGYQFRPFTKSPDGCVMTTAPLTKQTCTYVPTNTSTTTTTTTTTSVACTYSYSDWSTCDSSGFQYRRVLSQSPDGCNPAIKYPITRQSCTASPTSTSTTTTDSIKTACSYTYSTWSPCDINGRQKRYIVSKTPLGCYDSAIPILEQSSTYSSLASSSSIICAYNLSDWSACNAQGMQTRNIISRTPTGCYDSEVPRLIQPCSMTTTGETTAVTSATPYFNFLNVNGGEVLNGTVKIQGTVSGAYGVEYYLIQQDSNTPKFLGRAALNSQRIWEYSFDSTQQPNGTFFVRPRIKNAYGTYEGEKRLIIILNATPEMSDAENKTASEETVNVTDRTNNSWQEKYFKSPECLEEKVCGGEADPDKDGLTNNEEFRYGTDPRNPDTDQDGFLDGDEVKNGFNPTKASPGDKSDKMVFESPKESGEIKDDLYRIEEVRVIDAESGGKKLKLTGKALPNSFVTVYIYSDPIVLTVKTDGEGNWSYELDKDLEDGQHEVYVAVTDNTGKITAKSSPLAFIKTAQAVEVIPPAEAAASQKAQSPIEKWFNRDVIVFISVVLAGLAISIAAIGLREHKANLKNKVV